MNIKIIFNAILPRVKLNKSLRILISVNTVIVFVTGLFTPFYAIFVQKIGGSIVFAGISWGLFSVVAGILTLLFGTWQLKVKEQELLLALGYCIRGVTFLSYAFMHDIAQLILTQVLWGIGVALATPAFDSVYSSHTVQDHSIAQWGQWEGVAAIAVGLAALIGGILIQTIGFTPIFIIMAASSFILGIYIWRLPRELL
ncbi:MAG TPA: MFS transporter [Candidatus Paceibacterota bacterium]|nr:MFS transporter [Candidatus Paceibacterota bacterium]